MWFIKRGKRTVTICGGGKAVARDLRIAYYNGRRYEYIPWLDDEDVKATHDLMKTEWLKEPHEYERVGE